MRLGFGERGRRGPYLVGGTSACMGAATPPAGGAAAPYQPARVSDGKPDLNGIWQALNTANFDLQGAPARPALSLLPAPGRSGVPGLVRATTVELPAPAVRALGAVGGMPAGEGVVVGGEIPYGRGPRRRSRRTREWLTRDPRSSASCLACPGPPTALPVPDPPGHQQDGHGLRVRQGEPHDPHGRWATAPSPTGWAGRAGDGTATRSWSR